MSDRHTLEVRWFFTGHLPSEVLDWFENSLPCDNLDEEAERSDLYLVVPGRDDLGLKLRSGRLELKTRTQSLLCRGESVRATGFAEEWQKYKWPMAAEETSLPDVTEADGARLVRKIRWRRKYGLRSKKNELVERRKGERPTRALTIELTNLVSHEAWTVAVQVTVTKKDAEGALLQGLDLLLDGYPGPPLKKRQSRGYPGWLLGLPD